MFVFIVSPDDGVISLNTIISYTTGKALVGYKEEINSLSGEFDQAELDEKYGIYEERVLVVCADGLTRQYPVDTVIVPAEDHPVDDIVRNPGKYHWDGKKLTMKKDWKGRRVKLGEGQQDVKPARSRK